MNIYKTKLPIPLQPFKKPRSLVCMPLYYAAYLIKKVQKFSRLGSDISTTAEPLCDIVLKRESVCLCMYVCLTVCM